jgi:hypothetical protein
MVWMVNDPKGSRTPAGLILKERMGRLNIVDGQWQIEARLPPRLPECTWTKVRWYLENGCDFQNLEPGERPSDHEIEMISPLLSDKQMELMMLDARKDLAQEQGAQAFRDQQRSDLPGSGRGLTNQSLERPLADSQIVTEFREMLIGADADAVVEALSVKYPMPQVLRARMEVANNGA